jgi:hypothetical protein
MLKMTSDLRTSAEADVEAKNRMLSKNSVIFSRIRSNQAWHSYGLLQLAMSTRLGCMPQRSGRVKRIELPKLASVKKTLFLSAIDSLLVADDRSASSARVPLATSPQFV